MSFSFSAVGTLDDVRKQLAAADLTHGGEAAEAARNLISDKVLALVEPTPPHPSQEKRFVVDASGHIDGNAASLTVSVRTHWVPASDEGTPEGD